MNDDWFSEGPTATMDAGFGNPEGWTRRKPAGARPKPNNRQPITTYTLPELLVKEIAPMAWIVPQFLPEGLTLFAGRP